jgi:hypothetical protein
MLRPIKLFQNKKRTALFVLLALCIIIHIFSYDTSLVEKAYATGVYPYIGKSLRFISGEFSFSVGDIFYTVFGAWMLYGIIRFFIKLFRRKITRQYLRSAVFTMVFTGSIIYILFNVLWGLNYNRQGIAQQLQLNVSQKYSTQTLDLLTKNLIAKVNANRLALGNNAPYPNSATLYSEAIQAYDSVEKTYPFLHYETKSIKTPVYNALGAYLGYSGYYNPFTGEAQVNTVLPKFVLPYVACHEMAHQIGYATEDEANFTSYLAASSSGDALFKYSAYLELYEYADLELWYRDSSLAKNNYHALDTLVKKDLHYLRDYLKAHENPVGTFVMKLYNQYLKANKQPQGINTYNAVTAWLIAYEKKYGQL